MRLTRLLTVSLGAVFVGCALLVAGAYLFQRSIMYIPPRGETPPPEGVEVVRLITSDGERLVAWHRPPQGDGPVFLYFGGNAEGLQHTPRWEEVAARRAGLFAVAYRGYSGSTGTPTEAGLHEDARTAYRWLAARYPAERIVIQGFSLGTGVAVRLAAERNARALILEAPFTAAVDVAGTSAPFLPVKPLMRDPFLSRDWIGRVSEPVLIVHGEQDATIRFDDGRRLYAMANQPKAFVAMRDSDHNSLVDDGLYGHIWRFLERLPQAPQAGSTASAAAG